MLQLGPLISPALHAVTKSDREGGVYCMWREVILRSLFTKTSTISAMTQLARIIHAKLHLVKQTVKL